MNNRDYKKFACGSVVHVYNRGNNKEAIFYDKEDYKAFLFRLGLALGYEAGELTKHPLTSVPYSRIRISGLKKRAFKLHSFCLMKNHFHFLIEQCSDVTVSKLISKVCTSYAKYFNLKHKRVGHVFQDKFKSVLIENNPQLMWASAYIHLNPIKDGYVNHPKEYQWSSYGDYATGQREVLPIIHTEMLMSVFKNDFEKETELMSKTVFDTVGLQAD